MHDCDYNWCLLLQLLLLLSLLLSTAPNQWKNDLSDFSHLSNRTCSTILQRSIGYWYPIWVKCAIQQVHNCILKTTTKTITKTATTTVAATDVTALNVTYTCFDWDVLCYTTTTKNCKTGTESMAECTAKYHTDYFLYTHTVTHHMYTQTSTQLDWYREHGRVYRRVSHRLLPVHPQSHTTCTPRLAHS